MKRSVGVTVIAVLLLLGSVSTLLMGITWAWAIGALVYVALAIWGICTSIGLLRLRNWARLSIIVFSVLLLMFGFGGLKSLTDASVVAGVRIFRGVFSAALVALGIWWVVFFTRTRVVQQFVPASPIPDAM